MASRSSSFNGGSDEVVHYHTMLPGNKFELQLVPSIMVCEKHQLPIEHYCETDDKVLCKKCKLTLHRQCRTSSIMKMAVESKSKTMFENIRQQLQEFEKKYIKFSETTTDDKNALRVNIQKCFDEITRIRQDVNSTLDDLETKMSAEIKDAEEKLAEKIDDHLFIADTTLEQIRQHLQLLKTCEKTQQEEVMFVGMRKVEETFPEIETVAASLVKEIISLEPSDLLTKELNQLECLGRLIREKVEEVFPEIEAIASSVVEVKTGISIPLEPSDMLTTELKQLESQERHERKKMSFLNMTVRDGVFQNVDSKRIQSIIFFQDDNGMLACGPRGLTVYDKDFNVKSESEIRVTSACKVSDNEIVVTRGEHLYIQVLEVTPDIRPKKTLDVGRICKGVCYSNDEIFVTCYDWPTGCGEVRVLDMSGQLQRRLGFDGQDYLFTAPVAVQVSRDGDTVFVADFSTDYVYCLDQRSHVIYKHSNMGLKGPDALLVDDDDNVLVCGSGSDNVQVISSDGQEGKVLLTATDGIKCPSCMAYRERDGCFIVGMHKQRIPLCVFSMTALS